MSNAGAKIMAMVCAMRASLVRGEEEGGSEIVQTVIVLGFAVGLGAALLALQGSIQEAITSAGTAITDMFSKVTSGAA
ncbi:hypothetical protein B5F40_01975 [Gordonibacter sp. An230]|uniref:hypothetical protein n=1 Tax=Gordonibacter sp. An230 TaxID=1965592 RepID=UPI000B3697FC|nr:hypothetical protein [Gordonibacter sp. An230]OUO92121.1 hypothetical protein B5F40_01975 [Gordonibacter sp. An230]